MVSCVIQAKDKEKKSCERMVCACGGVWEGSYGEVDG